MRTLPVIFSATLTALVIATMALVTSHFGTHDWPVAPTPTTATQLTTPSEEGDRAIAKRTERPRAAQPRDVRSEARPVERKGAAPRTGKRSGRPAEQTRGGESPNRVPLEQPVQPAAQPETDSAAPAPAPAADPAAPDPVRLVEDALQAREDDLLDTAPAYPPDPVVRHLLDKLP
jgi:hypothetical protein